MNRVRQIQCAFLLLGLSACLCAQADTPRGVPVRVGLPPLVHSNETDFYERWRAYLEQRLQRPVTLVHGNRCRELVRALRNDDVDFAWICGSNFVANERSLDVVAMPLFRGEPLERSYIIVPASDVTTKSLLDLRGRVFAYSDPDSVAGYLYTQYALVQLRQKPSAFFAKTFFTGGIGKTVEAVASGLAQGGAVDSCAWEGMVRLAPELAARTRVVEKSPPFGHMPFVARRSTPPDTVAAMRKVLLGMSRDAEGKELLAKMNFDGFAAGDRRLYGSIGAMRDAVGGAQ
jgi:phosphate/phosphite/phosphonate ABC transporter binding protein